MTHYCIDPIDDSWHGPVRDGRDRMNLGVRERVNRDRENAAFLDGLIDSEVTATYWNEQDALADILVESCRRGLTVETCASAIAYARRDPNATTLEAFRSASVEWDL